MDAKARAFAEEAIRAVGRADAPTARTFIAQACEADHHIGPLADTIYLACAEIDSEGGVSASTWNTLADAVDSAELLAVVEGSRT
ncbi:MAG: hypothetical protein L0Z49_00340 [Actinobacteria bacterium]|nr:hypothetical protein [Actinomycetota bacterium]MCI0542875.1 hypothetical protein [Actinomycetota bacterium]MCI0679505.1 hypothetical protein [Actinomycetota bacterium]